jgi:hypothetical protein
VIWGNYTHASPKWQGVLMSQKVGLRPVHRPRPAQRDETRAARLWIERLERRQLLSAQCPTGPSAAPAVAASTIAAAPLMHFSADRTHEMSPGEQGPQGDQGTEANVDGPDSPPPMERLDSGAAFAGFQFINPDGSAPPPIAHIVEVQGQNWVEVEAGATHVVPPVSIEPRKFKASDETLPPAASAMGPAVTPLAQTPAPATVKQMSGSVGRIEIFDAPTVHAGAPGISIAAAPAPPTVYLGPIALPHPAQTAFIAAPAVAMHVADGLAYASNKAGDVLALLASSDALNAVATYNFVHFDPAALLNDAMAAFSRESASLSFVALPTHSTARAWSITAAVIGLDLVLMGYCFQRSRRQKAAAALLVRAQR